MPTKWMVALGVMFTVACTSTVSILDDYEPVKSAPIVETPRPQASDSASAAVVERGRYMVELLGCGGCHTEGALLGAPDKAMSLAGSHVGIAHSNPLQVEHPGVVFPPNLTPDRDTGIGRLSDSALKSAISGRVGSHQMRRLKVMPVIAYSKVNDDDLDAIIAYLRTVPAVRNVIPGNVPAGTPTNELYVHFGVYRSREK